jgi:hypothetical protein
VGLTFGELGSLLQFALAYDNAEIAGQTSNGDAREQVWAIVPASSAGHSCSLLP